MAVARKVVKVANPGRRGKFRLRTARHSRGSPSRTTRRRRGNPSRRRRMTPKQIRHFGTKAQRAALKRRLRGKRGRGKASSSPSRSNPRRRKHTRRASNARPKVRVIYRYKNSTGPRKRRRKASHRKSNPALVVTLGSVNPKRRTKKVAKTRKHRRSRKSNPRHYSRRGVARHRRRRTNARKVTMNPRRRRRNRVHHRRRNSSIRRRNPMFGGRSTKSMLKIGGGVLLGVTITKMIPKYVPASISSSMGSGGIMAVLISAVSAFIGGWAVSKVDPEVGEAVLWGGIAQTMSVALNAFLPTVGGTFSLGDLVSGNFVVPQNPIRAGTMMPARLSGMGAAAFPRAF